MTKEILVKLGCEDIKEIRSGFEFMKNGFKFTIWYYKNDNIWTIDRKQFKDLEDLRYYISCL